VYKALRENVYPFPKVERSDARRPLQSVCIACTCEAIDQQSEKRCRGPQICAGVAIRGGWQEFLQYKGYFDNTNAIIWAMDPKSHLSKYSYQHLLAVASSPNPGAAHPA
jgi:hypothetical protein